jgi:anti-sigma factor RsiW
MTAHLRDDEIQDALDGRLESGTLERFRDHAGSCEACGARWRAFEGLKRAAAQLAPPELPAALAGEVAVALDAEDRRAKGAVPRPHWALLAAGIAGLAALGVVLRLAIRAEHAPVATQSPVAVVTRPPVATSLPVQVAQDFRDVRAGRVNLAVRTSEPAALEGYLAGEDVGFRPRVFDLAMMKQHLLGGSAREMGGRHAALFAYRGEDGSLVVCQMYRGGLADLPGPTRRREHNGIPFQIYDAGELTIVFWPEGDVVCVLVGDGPPDAVVALAFAKAMRGSANVG